MRIHYSLSRKKIGQPGEESGHFRRIIQIRTDCDADSPLYQIKQAAAGCHNRYPS
ncbi:MAG: hypothetical protein D5R96_04765 [Methanocalculus sp. MSAO_Arc2]|uniref:phosphoribosyl-AMP cyclohydrolase n=1 Tax=Methanocalculus sp. MSAO_Arc2 TaxID=2293855 RepID=UPI000FF23241|nr:MAG: hypothetical protein D5R96_04765 [Methanocalculus sp. MSAO_Arc2]